MESTKGETGFWCSACGSVLCLTMLALQKAKKVTCLGCGAVLKDRENQPTASIKYHR